jgi:tetratricopeptide (TPR) repeat protein/predicted  nucleic acid-binding Zn-ribbon protein
VKNRNWLDLAEYATLAGTGVGAIATLLTKQILYTATPLSLFLLLSLVNRRRVEQLTQQKTTVAISRVDQRLSINLKQLQQQTRTLPSFEDLAALRQNVLQNSHDAIARLQYETTQRIEAIETHSLGKVRYDISHLKNQYNHVGESLSNITSRLHRLTDISRVEHLEGSVSQLRLELAELRSSLETFTNEQKQFSTRTLQEQISHLQRRLNQLPQPFDASALKQDIASLMKVAGDMVSRRELARLAAQVEKLSQQNQALEQTIAPTRVTHTIFKKQLDSLHTRLNHQQSEQTPTLSPQLEAGVIEDLQQTVNHLEQRLNHLPAADPSSLRAEIQGIAETHMGNLQQQLDTVQQFAQNLERQQQTLRDCINHLPKLLDFSGLQNQLKFLTHRIDGAESGIARMQIWVEESLQNRIEEMNQQLQKVQPATNYGLVLDFKGNQSAAGQANNEVESAHSSRTVLEEALESAQTQIVLVWSRPDQGMLDPGVIQKFQSFLDRGGCLDIGWGRLEETLKGRSPRFLNQRWGIDSHEKQLLRDALNQLAQLKQDYPNQLRFKLLGTDENFLICDRTFAVLGIHPFAVQETDLPEVAIGLRTTDTQVIQQLINRFEDPMLNPGDANAYFNRAITRYDLGDKNGAIADYTEVLNINPDDHIACNNRGIAFYDLEDKTAAISDFEAALHLNPENTAAYYNRGTIRSEQGDKLGAIEDYSYATQVDPDCAIAYFYRGLERSRLGNKLGAIYDYSEVIRIEPENANAYLYRGLAQIKIGDKTAAIADLSEAARLFARAGDRDNHQQALATISRLKRALTTDRGPKLVSNGRAS